MVPAVFVLYLKIIKKHLSIYETVMSVYLNEPNQKSRLLRQDHAQPNSVTLHYPECFNNLRHISPTSAFPHVCIQCRLGASRSVEQSRTE